MREISLRDVLAATGGHLLGGYRDLDTEITSVSSNTALTKKTGQMGSAEMFIAFRGNDTDGHDYIEEAFDLGCIGCLTEKTFDHYREDRFYVLVDNTLDALWKVIALRLSRVKAKIICVTGSVGKTTTTGMIASVLSQRFNVFYTHQNFNDEYLSPDMIFKINGDHEFAVLELGMGMYSSVSRMAKIIRPDVIVLTRIGHAHIAKTGSLEATRDEKCRTEEGLRDGGIVIVNEDDPLQMAYPFKHKVVYYGSDIDKYGGLPPIQYDRRLAAYAAKAVGRMFGLGEEEIFRGISSFVPEQGRMDIVWKDQLTLIDSSFNASLESFELALDMLGMISGRKIAVLGDMLEIGEYAEELHERVGAYVTPYNANVVIAVGQYSDCIARAVDPRVPAIPVKTIPEAFSALTKLLLNRKGRDVVLVKGSHDSQVCEIADHLRELPDSRAEEEIAEHLR